MRDGFTQIPRIVLPDLKQRHWPAIRPAIRPRGQCDKTPPHDGSRRWYVLKRGPFDPQYDMSQSLPRFSSSLVPSVELSSGFLVTCVIPNFINKPDDQKCRGRVSIMPPPMQLQGVTGRHASADLGKVGYALGKHFDRSESLQSKVYRPAKTARRDA
jgi:hypothetical protein